MAYTFLDNSLNTIGVLTNKGGQTNDYWGDSITHEIATSQDVLTSVSLSVDKPSVNIDTSGNQKTWNHVIQGLSFNIDGIGRKVNENDYLIYQEGTNGKYYLMAITQVDESAVQSGFHYKTVQGLNAAAYDLSRKTLRAKSFAQIPDNTQEKGTAQNILKYIFEDINWDVRTIGSFGAVDYDIAEGATAQAVLLDIIGMFEAEVDAYVQLNNWGKGANVFNKNGSIKRIFDFSTSLGKYRGETIRYDKNMVSITKTGARDSMYTKLYVNGNNITIADANKGADFIVDDVANRKYNKLGAVSTPVTYLEGIITNSAIESPTALLAWGKKQLKILNHPRYNYQISATNDDKVQLGDTVIIQDTHASDPIYLKSKVISKTVSLADPANNSFIVGEFSPIVIGADNGLEDTNKIMQLVNQANQTAINAQNKANENAKKIVDTRTNLEKTIDQKLQEGKDYSESLDQKQKEAYDKFEAEINAGMDSAASERAEISKKADDMLTTANKYSDDIYTKAVANAKEQASSTLTNANQALAEAKYDLTTAINQEISDRNKAVQTVNSQAQSYAEQAKSDALNAITKEVSDREKAVSALDTKATKAVNQAKSDINDTINALSVGGRNLLLNSQTLSFTVSNNDLTTSTKVAYDSTTNMWHITAPKSDKWNGIYFSQPGRVSNTITKGQQWAFSFDIKGSGVYVQIGLTGSSLVNKLSGNVPTDWTRVSSTGTTNGTNPIAIFFKTVDVALDVYIKLPKLEIGNKATDWTPAPEDVVLDYTTKDNEIKATITQYKDTNDGKVSKAQTDATTALGLVATKVSQTDYDKKTGDLSTKYTQVKQTVDSQATDIVDIKATATSQASKINSISSDVDGTKQSISDIKTTQDGQSDKINQITSDVNGTKQSITDIQTKDGKQDTRMGNIETSVSGVKSDFSTYKTTNDGAVKKAQTTAQTAVDGLKTKVSQTDYNKKTGDLSTKVNTVTQTANETKNELAKVSKTVGSQSTKINTISNTVDGTKQTISDLKTEQGRQSGSIATLQSRADGFDATVTKVDNLSVGGRNLLSHTNENAYASLNIGNGTATQKFVPFINGYKSEFQWTKVSTNWSVWQQHGVVKDRLKPDTDYTISFMINAPKTFTPHVGLANGSSKNYIGELTKSDKPAIANKDTHMEVHFHSFKEGKFPQASDQTVYINGFIGIEGVFQIWDLKLEEGNIATTWTPAPEDLSNATAKAQLTADKANLDLSTYKTDANGRINKAQADIKVNAKAITQKVSQSDYDKKTGALTSSVNKAQSTADTATQTIGTYKETNDKRVASAETKIKANSDAIKLTVSKTDFDKKTGELSGKFTQQKQTVDKISNTVSELQAKANSQGQVNQLMNTEFNPDTENWTLKADNGSRAPYKSFASYGSNGIGFNTVGNPANTFATLQQTVILPNTRLATDVMSLSWRVNTRRMDNYCHIWLYWQDANGKDVSDRTMGSWNDTRLNQYNVLKWENISIPIEAKQVLISFETREGTNAYIFQPMLTFEKVVGDYVPGNYNNNSRVAALEVGIDSITGLVNDPKKGLSATWSLANQGQTLAVKAQKDAKTADGKAVAAQKDATTAVTTAKGTQTTVTSVQKDVKDVQSKQTQTANQLTTEIKDRKNGDTNTLTQAKNFTSSSITNSVKGMQTKIDQSAAGVVAQVQYVNRLFNTQFTPDLVGWNVSNNGRGGYKNNFYRSYLNDGNTVVGVNTASVNVDGTTTKFYAYFEQDVALPGNNSGTPVSLSWDSTTNDMKHYANLFVQFKNADGSTISAVNQRWDSPVGKGWQHHVWENISVPTNAHHIRVSFQVREGANVYLKQPMLTFTPKAKTYMPGGYHSTSTVLELFDGRFALGIKNNTGNIISGINGDSTGLSIVGKKITISGDTTFLGTNFMNGALIKNASIDSAKIKNLEVDKLTGNTTKFVKSSWDNAYGNQVFINSYNIAFFTNSRRSATTLSEGRIHMAKYNDYTKITESVGGMKHSLYPRTQNQDYLNIYLDGWSNRGGHGSGAASHGGDGILFSVSDGDVQKDGPGTRLLEWDNELLAGSQGIKKGWHFWDFTEVNGEDFMVTPKGAYQGLRIGSYKYNGTTYPTIMGDQMKGNGPGILMGSTELYFLYKKHVYPLSKILH